MKSKKFYRNLFIATEIFLVLTVLFPVAGNAQITLDGTLGPQGPLTGPDYTITENMGQQHGGNLFHSFGEFNVNTHESATFTGPGTVENIIGRVTGGNSSWIDGRVGSTIQGADLFLINPSGMMFGPNAELEVSGSFHASTADYLKLEDGGRFDATRIGSSLLTSAPPSAFGFLGDTPPPLSVSGSLLKVPEGKTLSLIGGDVSIGDGTLYAPDGRINIVGVGSAGEAVLKDSGLETDSFERMGSIRVSHSSPDRPEVNGLKLGNVDVSGNRGGAVFIRGGQFVVDGGYILSNTLDGDSRGMDIRIDGETTIMDTAGVTSQNGIYGLPIGSGIHALTFGTGKAGDITLETGSLTLTQGGAVTSSSLGAGQGGHLTVTVEDFVSISGQGSNGFPSGLGSSAFGDGAGGAIFLSASDVFLDDGGTIQASTGGAGNAGSIFLDVERLSITDGAYISAGTEGAGDGGLITINAAESVFLSGLDSTGTYASSLLNCTLGTGKGGTISVSTPSLTLENNALIRTLTSGEGQAGDTVLDVERLSLTGGSKIAADTYGVGQGGHVIVSSEDSVILSGLFSSIGAVATGEGDAGSVSLNTERLSVTGGAYISTGTSGAGDGGLMSINAGESVLLSGQDSTGTYPSTLTSTSKGSGKGGTISVFTPSLTLEDNAQITTLTLEEGQAGDVFLDVGRLRLTGEGRIVADTYGVGDGGNIRITTPSLTIDHDGAISGGTSEEGRGADILLEVGSMYLTEGGRIDLSTWGAGQGGNLTVRASSILMSGLGDEGSSVIDNYATDRGDAGNIDISTSTLEIRDGASIDASTHGEGRGGEITIRATDSVQISGVAVSDDGTFYSSIWNSNFGAGDAGRITIETPVLTLADGGEIMGASGKRASGRGGQINITTDRLSISGEQSFIDSGTGGSGPGGEITISASDSVLISGPGAFLSSATYGTGDGGIIYINTPLLEIENGDILTDTFGDGNAGDISLNVGILNLKEKAYVSAGTEGAGQGGQLKIDAEQFISIQGNSGLHSTATKSGDGGTIFVSTPSLEVQGLSGIFANTDTEGNAGNIFLDVGILTLKNDAFISTLTYKAGNAGNIFLDVETLTLKDGAIITTNTEGSGRGGQLEVNAAESIFISRDSGFLSATKGSGDGGVISVKTPSLTMENEVAITTTSRAEGNAGNIFLDVGDLSLTGIARIDSSATQGGKGGSIRLQADRIRLKDGGTITAKSTGTGNAGDITITASDEFYSDHGFVTTAATQAAGGNIYIASEDIRLTHQSDVTASVTQGEGGGGNVTMDAKTLVALDGSEITAQADQGFGGDITLNADVVLFSDDVVLSASSNVVGREGTVTINAPETDISGSLVELAASLLSAEALLPEHCAARNQEESSTFLIRGPGGVPPKPDELIFEP